MDQKSIQTDSISVIKISAKLLGPSGGNRYIPIKLPLPFSKKRTHRTKCPVMISSSWQWQRKDASSYLVMPSSPSCNDPTEEKEIDLKDLASTENDPLSIFLFPIWYFLCFVLSTFTTFLLGRMGRHILGNIELHRGHFILKRILQIWLFFLFVHPFFFGWECIAMVFSHVYGVWNIAFAAGLFGELMSNLRLVTLL